MDTRALGQRDRQPQFGFLVSESGVGCTWAENSSENRLTPWRNDPVSDPPGEALYLRDEDTGEVWSPNAPADAAPTHPIWSVTARAIRFSAHKSQPGTDAPAFCRTGRPGQDHPIEVRKYRSGPSPRSPSRIMPNGCLGQRRSTSQPYIIPEYDITAGALLARNAYNHEFRERVAFLACTASPAPSRQTARISRAHGRLGRPAALDRIGMAARSMRGWIRARRSSHTLVCPWRDEEVTFLLG